MVSRTELIEHIYDQDFDRDSNTIEVFVTRIRKKLGADVITTIRGLGYSLDDPAGPGGGMRCGSLGLAPLPLGEGLGWAPFTRRCAMTTHPNPSRRGGAVSAPPSQPPTPARSRAG